MSATLIPTEIKLLQKSHILQLHFADGQLFELPCSYLRAHSPSAETRFASLPPETTDVNIISIEPVGQYGVKFRFDDGHDTGIYSWQTLHDLALKWQKTGSASV